MSASETLRNDHKQIKRLDKIISKCYSNIYAGKTIPFSHLENITLIISEFLDSIHYSREEDSYFPCVASYDHLKKEIRALLIEHEFSRRIASKIVLHLSRWKNGEDSSEPVARFLRTYSIYLNDHKIIGKARSRACRHFKNWMIRLMEVWSRPGQPIFLPLTKMTPGIILHNMLKYI